LDYAHNHADLSFVRAV